MASIIARLDPETAKPGETVQTTVAGREVVIGLFPMFDPKHAPIFDRSTSVRERAHALVDAFFDQDERLEQGHFYSIKFNL